MERSYAIFIVSVLLLAVAGCSPATDYTVFAKCLTEKGVVMYGASWCPHCQGVKKEFGDAFRFVDYVECDENTPGSDPERCAAAQLKYFPTFQFADSTKLFGEVGFEILAQKSGCSLP